MKLGTRAIVNGEVCELVRFFKDGSVAYRSETGTTHIVQKEEVAHGQ